MVISECFPATSLTSAELLLPIFGSRSRTHSRETPHSEMGRDVPIQHPKVGRCYTLLRPVGGEVKWVQFMRLSDGSGGVFEPSVQHVGWTTWRELWDELRSAGFILLEDAIHEGLVPADWSLPSDWIPPAEEN